MIAYTTAPVSVTAETTTTILSWTADGVSAFAGFLAQGQVPAVYSLCMSSSALYKYQTNGADMTAFVLDKPWVPENGSSFALRVYHEAPGAKTFTGTILGATSG